MFYQVRTLAFEIFFLCAYLCTATCEVLMTLMISHFYERLECLYKVLPSLILCFGCTDLLIFLKIFSLIILLSIVSVDSVFFKLLSACVEYLLSSLILSFLFFENSILYKEVQYCKDIFDLLVLLHFSSSGKSDSTTQHYTFQGIIYELERDFFRYVFRKTPSSYNISFCTVWISCYH